MLLGLAAIIQPVTRTACGCFPLKVVLGNYLNGGRLAAVLRYAIIIGLPVGSNWRRGFICGG